MASMLCNIVSAHSEIFLSENNLRGQCWFVEEDLKAFNDSTGFVTFLDD
jgi:hypothetical protein